MRRLTEYTSFRVDRPKSPGPCCTADLSNWWTENVILRGIHRSRRHELPHGNSGVADEWNQLVAGSLALSSSKCSGHCWRRRQESGLCIHALHMQLQPLLLGLEPLLLVTKLVLFGLQEKNQF